MVLHEIITSREGRHLQASRRDPNNDPARVPHPFAVMRRAHNGPAFINLHGYNDNGHVIRPLGADFRWLFGLPMYPTAIVELIDHFTGFGCCLFGYG